MSFKSKLYNKLEVDKLNVNKLEVGMTVKNYKELCELLEVEQKAGNAKKAQLKELDRYINYEKEGHKIIVKEVYEIPLPPNNNITQYIPLIERLILHYIVVEGVEHERLYIPKSKLFQLLKMINTRYSYFKYHQMQLSNKLNIHKDTIIDFYQTSDSLLKRNIERALNSLVSQSLIHWNHVFTVVEVNKQDVSSYETFLVNDIETDQYGDKKINVLKQSQYLKLNHREATDSETELILEIQRDTLETMGIDSIHTAIKNNLADEFYNEVYNRLKLHTDIVSYYKSYMIIFNMEHIKRKYNNDVYKFLLEEETEKELYTLLNSEITDTMIENGMNRHHKALDGIGSIKKVVNRSSESYVPDTNKLIENLIKLIE